MILVGLYYIVLLNQRSARLCQFPKPFEDGTHQVQIQGGGAWLHVPPKLWGKAPAGMGQTQSGWESSTEEATLDSKVKIRAAVYLVGRSGVQVQAGGLYPPSKLQLRRPKFNQESKSTCLVGLGFSIKVVHMPPKHKLWISPTHCRSDLSPEFPCKCRLFHVAPIHVLLYCHMQWKSYHKMWG